MRVGIDVGGTNTDAVLMNGDEICATAKAATTSDVTHGIIVALELLRTAREFDVGAVDAVVVGTTHFTNALVETSQLAPTAVVRLAGPATRALPPLVDWPRRLVDAIGGPCFICRGGHEFDGRELSPVDEDELRSVAELIAGTNVRSVAIVGVFAVPYGESERRAATLLTREIAGLHVSLSHEIGQLGLLARENATVINACLRKLVDTVADALAFALEATGIDAPLFFTQNDGTAMDVEYARQYPVATFASGPANSMRGAAFLSGMSEGVVVDVGGTTTDVGMLSGGFPKPAPGEVEVAGVSTNFRMPHTVSTPVGGGSEVTRRDGAVVVGPGNVGHEITRRARVFGGDTLTTTDLAVAAGLITLGDVARVSDLDREIVDDGLDGMADRVHAAVQRLRTSSEPLPMVLVGGAAPLLDTGPSGFETPQRPRHYQAANAVGAALAQAGGEIDRIFPVCGGQREHVLAQAHSEAVGRAAKAGARPGTIRVVETRESPVTYLSGSATRVRVRALGELATRAMREVPNG